MLALCMLCLLLRRVYCHILAHIFCSLLGRTNGAMSPPQQEGKITLFELDAVNTIIGIRHWDLQEELVF